MIKPIMKKDDFRMDRIGEFMRLTWGFETPIEKLLLFIFLFLGFWKLGEIIIGLM